MDDTIVAVATPMGRGAIALLRLSGPEAKNIAGKVVKPWPVKNRVATLCSIQNEEGEQIDQAVVTIYSGPSSYTGEDTVEITTHGGVVAPNLVMGALLRAGAREALPGEFTRRAVLNGKLDLVQAEAVGDLIDAQSRAMHSAAINQLDGGLSDRINDLRSSIINIEALIAYDIDFPEEDEGPIDPRRITEALDSVKQELSNLLATAPVGEIVRTGAIVVIAGHPNAGKSSLFNAILGNERAIVTDIPGTTRDALEATIDSKPWPIRLIDTAGLRKTEDIIEQMGIEVSTRYLRSADVILACGESYDSVEKTVEEIKGYAASQDNNHAPVLRVRTKADIQLSVSEMGSEYVEVSGKTGAGISHLITRIGEIISEKYGYVSVDAPILTRERHRYAVETAYREILSFEDAWEKQHLPPVVAAVHLRAATHSLEEVVGAIKLDDILDKLFSAFCVGK